MAEVNIKSFGTVGNGELAQTAFRNAHNYLDSVGGGKLFVPNGLYRILGTVSYKPNVEMYGEGDGSIIERVAGQSGQSAIMFNANSGSNIHVHHLNIDINSITNFATFLQADYADTVRYHDIKISSSYFTNEDAWTPQAFLCRNAFNIYINNLRLYNCQLKLGATSNGTGLGEYFVNDCWWYNSQNQAIALLVPDNSRIPKTTMNNIHVVSPLGETAIAVGPDGEARFGSCSDITLTNFFCTGVWPEANFTPLLFRPTITADKWTIKNVVLKNENVYKENVYRPDGSIRFLAGTRKATQSGLGLAIKSLEDTTLSELNISNVDAYNVDLHGLLVQGDIGNVQISNVYCPVSRGIRFIGLGGGLRNVKISNYAPNYTTSGSVQFI